MVSHFFLILNFFFVNLNNFSTTVSLRKKCLSLGLCDVMHRALGRFALDESVTAACYMALSSMLNSEMGAAMYLEDEQGLEAEVLEDDLNELVVCPLSEPIAPHSTALSSAIVEPKSSEEVAMATVVSAIMRRLSSLGLGPICVETLRQYPSSRQVRHFHQFPLLQTNSVMLLFSIL